jgi:hypothetical protein
VPRARLGEQLLDVVALAGHVERAHGHLGVQAGADPLSGDEATQALDRLVVHAAWHVQALERHANLAGGHERRERHPGDRALVQHGVVEHDRGVVAAELERHVGDVPGGDLHDSLAARGRAREADVLDARVAHHDRAEHGVLAGDHVQHTGRQPLSDLAQRQHRRQRRSRRRLGDHRVPRHQRVRQARREDRERPVERVDDRHDPLGHVADRRVVRGPGDRLRGVELAGVLGRLVEAPDEHLQVDRGLEADLAVLAREHLSALVEVVRQRLERPQADLDALGRRQRRPGRPGTFCRCHGIERVLRARGGRVTDQRSVVGVADREPLAGGQLLPVDQERG